MLAGGCSSREGLRQGRALPGGCTAPAAAPGGLSSLPHTSLCLPSPTSASGCSWQPCPAPCSLLNFSIPWQGPGPEDAPQPFSQPLGHVGAWVGRDRAPRPALGERKGTPSPYPPCSVGWSRGEALGRSDPARGETDLQRGVEREREAARAQPDGFLEGKPSGKLPGCCCARLSRAACVVPAPGPGRGSGDGAAPIWTWGPERHHRV